MIVRSETFFVLTLNECGLICSFFLLLVNQWFFLLDRSRFFRMISKKKTKLSTSYYYMYVIVRVYRTLSISNVVVDVWSWVRFYFRKKEREEVEWVKMNDVLVKLSIERREMMTSNGVSEWVRERERESVKKVFLHAYIILSLVSHTHIEIRGYML